MSEPQPIKLSLSLAKFTKETEKYALPPVPVSYEDLRKKLEVTIPKESGLVLQQNTFSLEVLKGTKLPPSVTIYGFTIPILPISQSLPTYVIVDVIFPNFNISYECTPEIFATLEIPLAFWRRPIGNSWTGTIKAGVYLPQGKTVPKKVDIEGLIFKFIEYPAKRLIEGWPQSNPSPPPNSASKPFAHQNKGLPHYHNSHNRFDSAKRQRTEGESRSDAMDTDDGSKK